MNVVQQSSAPQSRIHRLFIALSFLLAAVQKAQAVDSDWIGSTTDWATPLNWSGGQVPDGVATFRDTGSTGVDSSGTVFIGEIRFSAAPNAQMYSINNNDDFFFITGTGIINDSTSAQTFNALGGGFGFLGASTASGGAGTGSVSYVITSALNFLDNSSAGNARIVNNTTGNVNFSNDSTAASAAITNDGTVTFSNTAKAGIAGITNNATGTLLFIDSSTADNATIVNDGTLQFASTSRAGTAGTITNNNVLDFANASSAESKTIVNTATMTFRDNALAGTADITNSAGTLTFSNSASAQGATIVNNNVVTFVDTSNAGTANITNNGSGSLTFSDASTAQGATILNDGGVQFAGTSNAGTANITNNAAASLAFSNASSAQAATILNNGLIQFNDASRAGTATITNNDTLDFSNASSADHATIANNSAIAFGGTSSAGNAAITYASSFASTTFSGNSSAGNASFQSTPGSFGNFTSFFDASTAASANIVNAIGVVSFTDTATAGNAIISNTGSVMIAPGVTSFALTSNAGAATITNNALGMTIFADQSSAASATLINNPGGMTSFGTSGGADTATAGNANILNAAGSGGIGSGGLTMFNASTTAGNATVTTQNGGLVFFFDTSTGGAARFVTDAGGAFDMSQLTSTGMTAGSIEGTGNYYLGSKALTVGGNNLSTTVNGIISDGSCGCFGPGGIGGSLVKVGSGTLTLNGINTYTGATTVNAGTLSVNGSTVLSSLTTVNAGGTLAGTGIVGNTLINGGTLSPGNSAGTLTVQGNLALTAAASYLYEVTPTVADRVNVTGTATLSGATVNAQFAAGSYVSRQYTIVNAAGGVIGTFGAQANTNLPSNFTSSLSYDSNNAYLNLTLNFTPTPPDPNPPGPNPPGPNPPGPNPPGPNPPPGFVPLTQNQQNVANALVGFFNRTGGIPLTFGALNLAGLTQVSGETATGSQQTTFDAMNLFLNLLTDPFVAGRNIPPAGPAAFAAENEALAYAAKRKSGAEREAFGMITKAAPRVPTFEARWNVWSAGYGGSQNTDGNAALGAAATTSQIYGGAVGADYWFSPQTMAGFAMAGGGTKFNVGTIGGGQSDLFQAGAFVRHVAGPAYITGALAYGWQDITTERNVTLAGLSRLRAQFNANAYSGRVEGGYRFAHPWLAITPYAAGQFTTFELPSYAESVVSGANTFALAYAGKSVTASRSELGLRSDKSWALGDGLFTLRGRAAWAHDFNTDRNVQATFQTLPGASFVVNGAPRARNAALTTGAAEWSFASGLALAAIFEGEFSDVTSSYAGKGVARYTW